GCRVTTASAEHRQHASHSLRGQRRVHHRVDQRTGKPPERSIGGAAAALEGDTEVALEVVTEYRKVDGAMQFRFTAEDQRAVEAVPGPAGSLVVPDGGSRQDNQEERDRDASADHPRKVTGAPASAEVQHAR